MSKNCKKSAVDTITATDNETTENNATETLDNARKVADDFELTDDNERTLERLTSEIEIALKNDENARKQASDITNASKVTIRHALLTSYAFLYFSAIDYVKNNATGNDNADEMTSDLTLAKINDIYDETIKNTYENTFGYNDKTGEPKKPYRKSCYIKVVSTIKQCFPLVLKGYFSNIDMWKDRQPVDFYEWIFDEYKLDKQGGQRTAEKLSALFAGDYITIDEKVLPAIKEKQKIEKAKESREKNAESVLSNLNLDEKAKKSIKESNLANGIKSAVAVIQDNPTLFNGVETAKERHPETTSDRVAYILSLIENLTTDERGDLLNALNG